MANVYILYSKQLNKFYTGSCVDLTKRMTEHRSKIFKDAYTSKADDWELYFTISDLAYLQSRKIEAHIKRMKSSRYIKNLAQYPEIVQKLRDQYKAGSSR